MAFIVNIVSSGLTVSSLPELSKAVSSPAEHPVVCGTGFAVWSRSKINGGMVSLRGWYAQCYYFNVCGKDRMSNCEPAWPSDKALYSGKQPEGPRPDSASALFFLLSLQKGCEL